MNIRQLMVFRAVSEELHFSRAADKLCMTQPAVSHTIHDLEAELGFPLFDRIRHKIYLTQPGKLFYQKTVRFLNLYEELTQQTQILETSAPLRIGSSITIANFWLPEILNRFQTVCPHTPIRVEVSQAADIARRLLANEIDLAFLEGVIREDLLEAIPFSHYQITAMGAPSFYPAAPMTPQELAEKPLLLREKGSAIRDAFDSALLLHNAIAEPIWTSVNSQALIQAAKHGLGITVLPKILAEDELNSGSLVPIPVDGMKLVNQNCLVIHREKQVTAPMQSLIEITRSLPETEPF